MNARTNDADSAGGAAAPAIDVTTARVSSPAATGGAGTTFEQHVGAYWLAQLLVGAIPPIAIDTTVAEVSFQTERLGWHTDDFLVVCTFGGVSRNLPGQVKRSFTVSASNQECVQTVTDFWKDFNASHFSKDHDRFALVTLRGTNTLLKHFVGLLDCARAARGGVEFEQRLATEGFISKKAVRYCGELQEIIGDIEGKSVTAADIWPFLRALHVLSLDLHSSTRQTEGQIRSMLAITATDGDPVASAGASWNELIVEASTAMGASRSLRRDDLPAATLARHGAIGTNERRVLQALGDHTEPVLRAIRSKLGNNLHLPRAALVQELLDTFESAQIVLVTGPAGCGKSTVGKDAVRVLAPDHFLFAFRVEEFAQPHLDTTLADAQVPTNWARLRAILGAQDRKVVLVESVERLLEKTTRDAFTDLMTLAADDSGLRILLTCRDYSVEQVRTSFLKPYRINHTVVRVPPLEDTELTEAEVAYPALAIPLKSPALRDILRNPFVLDKAIDIPWSSEKSLPQTEREFRALFWSELVRGGDRVAPAMGRPREEVLQIIAVRRAQALSAHVPATGLDAAVVESLRGDSLITSSDNNALLVATAHDVLEDWAILQWLEEQHLSEASFKTLSHAIGTHPAVRRSYRKWVAELVERDAAAADRLFQAAVSETEISVQFRDDTLVSRADDQVYQMERKKADALPHRQDDLEAAVVNLQFGTFAPRVHALLDNHLAALPPKEQQDEDDRLWRLAIHRMDLRQYSVSDTPGPEIPDPQTKSSDSPQRYVRLEPTPPEADVQAMVDESSFRLAAVNARLGVLMWGVQAFRRETGKYDPAQWAAKLSEAQAMDRQAEDEDSRHAPGFVAAVCTRDCWDDMTSTQIDWCVDRVCAEVLRHAADADRMERVQNNPMAADRACAFLLVKLLSKPLNPTRTKLVKTAFAAALTHPVEQVRSYATRSIDDTVWAADRALALRCVNAIAAEAIIIDKARDAEQARPYDERRDLGEITAAATADIRARFWKDEGIAEDAHVTLDISDGFGAHALKRVLVILGHVPQDPVAIAAFTRASHTLAGWWTSNDDRRSRGHRDFHTESDVSQRIQEFLLRTSREAARRVLAPLLAAVDRHSQELKSVMQGLTQLQDADPNTPQYWFLWELIADAVKPAKWIALLDTDRHPDGTDLLSAVFLTLHWKDDVRHWQFVDGHAHLVHALFEALPTTSIVLDAYARFLYHIGDRSLPDAFVRVGDALRRGNTQKMLARSNTVFVLEVLLQRYVYGRPLELKGDKRIRDAVLFILDCLVEAGSAAAFRMRDDFVTPAA